MSAAGIVVLVVGVGLLVGALAWRAREARRAYQHVLSALVDHDEFVRAAAVALAGSGSISRYAEVLLAMVRGDPSPLVRDRVMEVVARNQWEPAGNRAMVELRLEVRHRLEQAEQQRQIDVAPNTFTVLVTGAGGPAGISVIRALRQAGHRVVAVDTDPLSAGLRLADHGDVVPRADDPDYVGKLIEIAKATRATAVVPTIAEELLALAGSTAELDAAGIAHFLPDPAAVSRCIDKWQFANTLREGGVPAPATGLGTAQDVPGPWIVKPRFGRGSRDVYAVDQPRQLGAVMARVEDPIVQTRLRGREFTADALVGRDGDLVGAVFRWRLETRGGISTKGETFADADLSDGVGKLLRTLDIQGAVNVQGFVDKSGGWSFVEVNPRFSGGLPLSLAAGADVVGEYLRAVVGENPRPERLSYRSGVRMTRYFEEIIEG